MENSLLIFATTSISAVIYLIIGFLLAIKQKIEIINGIDFSELKNKKGFCSYLGNSFLASGTVLFVLGFLVYLKVIGLLIFISLSIIFYLLPVFHVFHAKNKYSQGTPLDGSG